MLSGASKEAAQFASRSVLPSNILFICTHNSCRSVMAEAILNRRAFRLDGRAPLRAFSAGLHPAAGAHPMALELLGRLGYFTAFAKYVRFFSREGGRVDGESVVV